ncbi:MAG: DNA-binding response regulator [Chloroflexota bacterium]
MEQQVTILLVDDDELLCESLALLLRQQGYRVLTAPTGAAALEQLRLHRPDLLVLDVGLPDLNGIELCRRLRQRSGVPVIFLTAYRHETEKVLGLEVGGDDYITKPFSSAELIARTRAILRRSAGSSPLPPTERLQAGDIELDTATHTVTVRGQPVELTAREFALLHVLMQHAGRVLHRRFLFDQVWGADFVGDEKALDVYIHQLRRKLERDPQHPQYIHTVRGVGYRFGTPHGVGRSSSPGVEGMAGLR